MLYVADRATCLIRPAISRSSARLDSMSIHFQMMAPQMPDASRLTPNAGARRVGSAAFGRARYQGELHGESPGHIFAARARSDAAQALGPL
eukprot:2106520-Pyramimonas_sp.AAC.1